MGFLKRSLLVSVCLFWGIHSAWGMKGSSSDGGSLKPASSISNIQDSEVVIAPVLDRYKEYENDEVERYKLWLGRYNQTQQLKPGVVTSTQDFEEAFSTLKEDENPLAYRGEVYLDDSPKKAVASSSSSSSSSAREDVAYVGPKHMNYIQREDGAEFPSTYEVFAVPQEKDPQIDRGAYSRKHQPKFIEVYSLAKGKMKVDEERDKRKLSFDDTDIIFDPGHGIDHAITITHNGSNSTADVRNYTPQNAYYNRFIRNELVPYAKEKGYSYKEIAIYAEKPLLITREKSGKKLSQPIPEGFIFLLFSHDNAGDIEKAFYFPNFYSYTDDTEGQEKWEFFAQKYRISNEIAKAIYGHHEISSAERLRTNKRFSENAGYRTLSGRFEVLPEGNKWPVPAKNAFVRTCAIYQMERAAEYDIKTENMLQIAQLFNDAEFVYSEFEGSLYVPSLARYWVERALKEVERKEYPAEDVFFFMSYESQIPIKPEEMANIINSFEQKLEKNPNTEHIAKLLQYFDEQHNEPKYVYWSHKLSSIVRNGEAPQSVVINETTRKRLIEVLSNTNILNIVLDFEITQDNVKNVIEGFKQRAINEKTLYEQNLVFLELPKISSDALKAIFHSFEYGIEGLYVDVRETAVKLPSYDREEVQKYMRKNCPKTRIVIND